MIADYTRISQIKHEIIRDHLCAIREIRVKKINNYHMTNTKPKKTNHNFNIESIIIGLMEVFGYLFLVSRVVKLW